MKNTQYKISQPNTRPHRLPLVVLFHWRRSCSGLCEDTVSGFVQKKLTKHFSQDSCFSYRDPNPERFEYEPDALSSVYDQYFSRSYIFHFQYCNNSRSMSHEVRLFVRNWVSRVVHSTYNLDISEVRIRLISAALGILTALYMCSSSCHALSWYRKTSLLWKPKCRHTSRSTNSLLGNTSLPSMPTSSKLALTFRFSNNEYERISSFPMHATCCVCLILD
jgi:hypothetical protein